MRIKEYLKENKISIRQYAKVIDISAMSLSRIVRNLQYPRADIMQRIVDATKGEVTPNDFLNIPNKNINKVLTHSKAKQCKIDNMLYIKQCFTEIGMKYSDINMLLNKEYSPSNMNYKFKNNKFTTAETNKLVKYLSKHCEWFVIPDNDHAYYHHSNLKKMYEDKRVPLKNIAYELNCNESMISRWLNGSRKLSKEKAIKIYNYLKDHK